MNQDNPMLDDFFSGFKSLLVKERTIFIGGDEEYIGNIYFLKKGLVKQYSISQQGDEVVLNIFKSSSYFPLVHVFSSVKNHCYFETMSPSEIIRAPSAVFLSYVKNNPNVLHVLIETLSLSLYDVTMQFECILLGNAYNRVILALINYARHFGISDSHGGRTITIPITHKDISCLIGLTRETVSREIEKLYKKDVLQKQNGLFHINNMQKLMNETFLL